MTARRKPTTHGAIGRIACDAEIRDRIDAGASPTLARAGQRNDLEGERALDSVRRVAVITYHSSPLVGPGSDDAGGMTVYVRELAAAHARLGVHTDVFTSATGAEPLVSRLGQGVRVAIEAGPRRPLPKERLPAYITEFVFLKGPTSSRRPFASLNADGVCDHPACVRVRALVLEDGPFPQMAIAIRDDLLAIGIDLEVEPLPFEEFLEVVLDPMNRVPITLSYLVFRDYPNGSALFLPYFYGPFAGAAENYNVSRVGATQEQLRNWGYSVTSVPSVDEKIEECIPLVRSEQVTCWAEVDKLLMEEVVPFAPYLFVDCVVAVSPRVANYSVDQFTGYPAPDHMAVVVEPQE